MENKKPFRTTYLIGLCAVLVSLTVYLLAIYSANSLQHDFFSGNFFVNYFFCIGYFLLVMTQHFTHHRPRPAIPLGCWMNLVVLFTISAFSLNTSMHVFAPFPGWLSVYTVVSALLFMVFPFIRKLPTGVKIAVYILTGCALVLSLHLLVFLSPIMPISVAVFWFFGISLHTFTPVLWLIAIGRFLFVPIEKQKLKLYTILGVLIPLAFLGYYLYQWREIQTKIKDIVAEKNIHPQNMLPDAIALSQQLPSDPLADEIIISPFKSQIMEPGNDMIMGPDDAIEKFHDPLAIIATSWYGKTEIDQHTAETLLNIRQDARHKTSRRLWTGTSLSTSTVSNQIEVFPQLRLAYQEKIITIHNNPDKKNSRTWFTSSTQEAVYTFHVPQGSFVTSLSLWINGKEEKSRLSTRQKADSAYSTVVGVEQRDPALVHWQEGNRITVTIFPCTPAEDRKFKIGFTTPLLEQNGSCYLENVWFEGPHMQDAREATRISFTGQSFTATDVPEHLVADSKNNYVYKGDYEPYWKLGIKKTRLSPAVFSFNGYRYHLTENKYADLPFNAKQVYLDLMCEWSYEEFEAIVKGLEDRDLYVWIPEKTKITPGNRHAIWEQLSTYQFSLPFLYTIHAPENSVIITKAGHKTPTLADLQNSPYADNTIEYLLKRKTKLKVFNIGEDLSPFWRSLHEMRAMEYARGNVDEVIAQIKKGRFTSVVEDSSTIALTESRMSVVKEKSTDSLELSTGPDHLLRLFAYNDVLRKTGDHYFGKDYADEIFREAEEGYVVTPVTSMIVLESEGDYKRMGIDENTHTVGNAGVLGGGAVPEPHEWALIGLVLIFIARQLILLKKKKQANVV